MLALALFAVVAAMASVLTLHAGQLIRTNRACDLDIELRQMIDVAAAYARLHRDDWPGGDGPMVLDATDLTQGPRTAEVTVQPIFIEPGRLRAVTVTARISLPRDRFRTLAVRVPLDDD